MMTHFGAKIVLIESNWSTASGLTTNIEQLNRATALLGFHFESAATLTWDRTFGHQSMDTIRFLLSEHFPCWVRTG